MKILTQKWLNPGFDGQFKIMQWSFLFCPLSFGEGWKRKVTQWQYLNASLMFLYFWQLKWCHFALLWYLLIRQKQLVQDIFSSREMTGISQDLNTFYTLVLKKKPWELFLDLAVICVVADNGVYFQFWQLWFFPVVSILIC